MCYSLQQDLFIKFLSPTLSSLCTHILLTCSHKIRENRLKDKDLGVPFSHTPVKNGVGEKCHKSSLMKSLSCTSMQFVEYLCRLRNHKRLFSSFRFFTLEKTVEVHTL